MTENEKKGIEGEHKVFNTISNILCDLRSAYGLKPWWFERNVYVEYPSILGDKKTAKMTTEIDIMIGIQKRIILCEIKNESFDFPRNLFGEVVLREEAKSWSLTDGEEVSNPIQQNRYHKMVLCDRAGVAMEDIITVEILLGQERIPIRTKYPNDFVLGEDNYEFILGLLLANSGGNLDVTSVRQKLEEVVIQDNLSFKHKRLVEDAKYLWDNLGKKANLKLLDRAVCPECGGWLVVRRCHSGKTKFIIGCTNHFDGCEFKGYYTDSRKKEGFRQRGLVTSNLEECIRMEEEHLMNGVTEYRILKEAMKKKEEEKVEMERMYEQRRASMQEEYDEKEKTLICEYEEKLACMRHDLAIFKEENKKLKRKLERKSLKNLLWRILFGE